MARNRLTQQSKSASPPPQIPANDRTEKSDHPAAQPDHEDKGSGTPSDWGEDVHPGPYDTSPAPATPGYQEPADHPAAKPGKPMKAADEAAYRKQTEKKAAKCIRIAQAMMPGGTVAQIEDQALDFMDLPNSQIHNTLDRLGLTAADEEDEDEDEGNGKEASHALTARMDSLEGKLDRILKGMNLFSEDDMMDAPMEEEAMMDEMLAEHAGRGMNDPEFGYGVVGEEDEDPEVEAMLEEMMAGRMAGEVPEAFKKNWDKNKGDAKDDDDKDDDKEDKKAAKADDDSEDDSEDDGEGKEASDEIQMLSAEQDPMGLMDASPAGDDDLSVLYEKFAGDDEDEDDDDSDDDDSDDSDDDDSDDDSDDDGEEEASKKASKTASLRPRPKKPSKGPKKLGNVSKTAASEVNELSSLWKTDPDVSGVFG